MQRDSWLHSTDQDSWKQNHATGWNANWYSVGLLLRKMLLSLMKDSVAQSRGKAVMRAQFAIQTVMKTDCLSHSEAKAVILEGSMVLFELKDINQRNFLTMAVLLLDFLAHGKDMAVIQTDSLADYE
jgi:hypothetical protein